MKTFLLRLVQCVWYLFATAIILTAVLVTVARLSTPLLNHHRSDFEAWASDLFASPVTIGEVSADWRGYIPEFTLSQVVTYDKETHTPAFEIKKIKIGFQLLSSAWQRRIVLQDMIISGAHVTVLQDEAGKLSIKDLPTQNRPGFKSYELIDILGWTFSQPYLSLREIDVEYLPFKGVKRALSFEKIALWNNGNHHKIVGNFVLQQEVPTEVQSRIEWTGELSDLQHAKGQAYFKVEGFSLPQWIKNKGQVPTKLFSGWQIHRGLGGADIWLDWDKQQIQQIQSIFQWYDLEFYSDFDQKTYPIQRLSGHIGWKREGEKQILAGDNLLIDFPEHFWPASTFYVALAPVAAEAKMNPSTTETMSDSSWRLEELRIGYLNIQDLMPIILANSSIPQDWRKNIIDLSPTGDFQNLALSWQGELTDLSKLSISGKAEELCSHPWRNFPGIKNLSGALKWNSNTGSLQLDGKALAFTMHSLFAEPLVFDKLKAYFTFQRDNEGAWSFSTLDAALNNADLDAKALIQMVFPLKGSPTIDLRGEFSLANAAQVTHYLPTSIMDHDLVAWLKAAFLNGHLESGKVAIHGALNDFPFDEKKELKPIPTGKRKAKGNTKFVEKPVEKQIEPVADSEKGLFELSAEFKDVDFHYAPEWPIVRQANGKLIFAGRGMKVLVNSAYIFDVPIKEVTGVIPYLGNDQSQNLGVEASVQTDLTQALNFIHESPLQANIGKNLDKLELQGPINLALSLSVPLAKPENAKVLGKVQVTQGKLMLPEWKLNLEQINGSFQFTENALTSQQLQGSLWGEPTTLKFSTVEATSGASAYIQATLAGRMDVPNLQTMLNIDLSRFFTGATNYQAILKLYESESQNNELYITSSLQGIAVDLTAPFGKAAAVKRDLFLGLNIQKNSQLSIQLKYGDLIQAKLNVTPGDGFRLIDIDSPQVKGRVRLAYPFDMKQPLQAQLDRIVLSSGNEETISSLNPQSLPPLIITAKQISYGDKNLGQLTLNTQPTPYGMIIQNFNLFSPDCNFKSHGQWTGVNKAQKSQLQGAMESGNVRRLLDRLGLHLGSLIVDKGKAAFDLQWKGPPYNFSLANATGTFSFALEKGRIINLNESSNNKMDVGRMLSLFSLQTIPRRLSLDFSDLFEQGYSFDYIRADFSLKQGNAYTQKEAVFEGPVAHVTASGRIGLLRQDYDLTLSVSPYLTDSLPVVAGALTLNPLVGAAAWLVNKVILSKQVSKAITYYYSVTGPWAAPIWKTARSSPKTMNAG